MRVKYRGCDIEVTREKSMAGYQLVYFSVFTEDGRELNCGTMDTGDMIREVVSDLKKFVDEFIESPEVFVGGDRVCPDCEKPTLLEYGRNWQCENPFCKGERSYTDAELDGEDEWFEEN